MKPHTIRFILFSIFTTVLTAFIAAQIANVQFGDQIELTARFSDVTGLFEGDAVRVAGVPVGVVTDIGIENGEAVVGLSIDSTISLPSDTRADITWLDLIGARQIDLIPGESSTPLAAGAEITDTSAVVDIGQLTAQLGPLARTLDPAELNELLESVFEVLDGNEQVVVQTITDTRALLEVVTSRDAVVEQLITDYADTATALAEREVDIRGTISDLTLLAETFSDTDALLAAGLEDAAALVEGADGFLDRNLDDVAVLIEDLASLVDIVDEQADTLDEVLAGLPASLRAFFSAGDRGDVLYVHAVCIDQDDPPCGEGGGGAALSRSAGVLGSPTPIDEPSELALLLMGGGGA